MPAYLDLHPSTRFANDHHMGRTYVPTPYEIESALEKTGQFSEEQICKIVEVINIQKRKLNRAAAEKRSKNLGLEPVSYLEQKIKRDLNEIVIRDVTANKLTHQQVADIALMARTTITAIMNRHLEEVSTDCLLRILGSIGSQIKISLK